MNAGSTGNPAEPSADEPVGVAQPAPAPGQYPGQVGGAAQPGWAPAAYPGYPYVVRRPTNGMAIAAMVTGIVALFSCQLVGAVAIYLAKKARTEIQASGEEGSAFATVGFVLGWVALGLAALGLLFFLAYLGFLGVIIASSGTTSS